MKGLDGKSGVTAGVTGVTEPQALQRGQSMHDLTDGAVDLIGDFLNDEGGVGHIGAAQRRLLAQRQRRSVEMAERDRRLARPKKDEARLNVADSHVERIVVEEGKLRFGFGIDAAVKKGALPGACLLAAERFRSDYELAASSGAIAVVDPTRVRVDASRRPAASPAGRAAPTEPFAQAVAALGGPQAAPAILAIRCIAEGKTVEAAHGELRALNLCAADVKLARGMLWAAAFVLRAHYRY